MSSGPYFRDDPASIGDLRPRSRGGSRVPWIIRMARAWRRRRADRGGRRALVYRDACDLIAGYGAEAYFEAKMRDLDELRGVALDANGPPRHWAAVMIEIGRLTQRPSVKDWAGYSAE
jgi:hypothetical protein